MLVSWSSYSTDPVQITDNYSWYFINFIACTVEGLFIGRSSILQAATNPYPNRCNKKLFFVLKHHAASECYLKYLYFSEHDNCIFMCF